MNGDDPNLVPISSPEALYQPHSPGAKKQDYKVRTPEQIAKDLILAHKNIQALEKRDNEKRDTINKLIREKDTLIEKDREQQKEIDRLEKSQRRTTFWTALAVTSVPPVWGIIGRAVWLYLKK
jgi:hypothetical protein